MKECEHIWKINHNPVTKFSFRTCEKCGKKQKLSLKSKKWIEFGNHKD